MFISKGWLISQRSSNAFFSTGSRKRPQSKAEHECVEYLGQKQNMSWERCCLYPVPLTLPRIGQQQAGPVCAQRGWMAKFGPSFHFFLHLWKKVDLSETFRTFRCLGFIFVQYLQGNSKGVVKQRAESKVTHPISESALRGFALHFL